MIDTWKKLSSYRLFVFTFGLSNFEETLANEGGEVGLPAQHIFEEDFLNSPKEHNFMNGNSLQELGETIMENIQGGSMIYTVIGDAGISQLNSLDISMNGMKADKQQKEENENLSPISDPLLLKTQYLIHPSTYQHSDAIVITYDQNGNQFIRPKLLEEKDTLDMTSFNADSDVEIDDPIGREIEEESEKIATISQGVYFGNPIDGDEEVSSATYKHSMSAVRTAHMYYLIQEDFFRMF